MSDLQLDPEEKVYEVELDGDTFWVIHQEGVNHVVKMDYEAVADVPSDYPDADRVLPWAKYNRVKQLQVSPPHVGTLKSLGLIPVWSSGFQGLAQPEVSFRMAIGHLQSARNLTIYFRDNVESMAWEHASVVMSCSYHAVELFYKAAILVRCPDDKTALSSHVIMALKARYAALFPHPEMQFDTQFDFTGTDVMRALGCEVERRLDDNQDQLFRYMTDRSGQGPQGWYNFLPHRWLAWFDERESHWKKVWARITAGGV